MIEPCRGSASYTATLLMLTRRNDPTAIPSGARIRLRANVEHIFLPTFAAPGQRLPSRDTARTSARHHQPRKVICCKRIYLWARGRRGWGRRARGTGAGGAGAGAAAGLALVALRTHAAGGTDARPDMTAH